jgi:hypothetical protein
MIATASLQGHGHTVSPSVVPPRDHAIWGAARAKQATRCGAWTWRSVSRVARTMLYWRSFTDVLILKGDPMADKKIKDLSVPSKSAGTVKGGAKASRKGGRKSR